jgi:hypothetical protein
MQEKFVLRTLKKVAAIGTGVAMLGATLTGALALDLKDYPSPFVKSGVYDSSNAFVAGDKAAAADTLGMVDIAADLQFKSKTAVSAGGGVSSVVGGTKKDIPMDVALNDATYGWSTALKDDDVAAFQDTTLDIDMNDVSDTYNVEDLLNLTSDISVESVLSDNSYVDDDFKDRVFLQVGKNSIQYRYNFKEALKGGNYLNSSSSSNTIDIVFLGKTLKIQGATASSITATVGEELFMKVGDSSTVESKTVKLVNVASGTGSSAAVVVDVDGVQKTISGTTSTLVNGIKIKIQDTFYTDALAERSATLIIGTDAVKTYSSGDAYIGEDTSDPDWVWVISGGLTSSPTLGINFDQNWEQDDEVLFEGDSISLPNDFATVKIAGLTQAATQTYSIAGDSDDLGNSTGATGTADGGAQLQGDNMYHLSISSDGSTEDGFKVGSDETDYIAFAHNGSGYVSIHWKDESADGSPYKWYAIANDSACYSHDWSTSLTCPKVQFDDALFVITAKEVGSSMWNLTIPTSGDEIYQEMILNIKAGGSSGTPTEVTLGSGSTAATGDFNVNGTDRSGLEEDVMTRDGIIFKDPKANLDSDTFEFVVPGDVGKEFRATVTVTGKSSVVTTGGATYSPVEITPATMLASEVSSPTSYNLIVVGGPCANKLAETVFGVSCSGWSLKSGEAMVKLAANGNKVAMLVAGTSAADTRMGAKAVVNKAMSGKEVTVKGTVSSYTVVAPAAAATTTTTANANGNGA